MDQVKEKKTHKGINSTLQHVNIIEFLLDLDTMKTCASSTFLQECNFLSYQCSLALIAFPDIFLQSVSGNPACLEVLI